MDAQAVHSIGKIASKFCFGLLQFCFEKAIFPSDSSIKIHVPAGMQNSVQFSVQFGDAVPMCANINPVSHSSSPMKISSPPILPGKENILQRRGQRSRSRTQPPPKKKLFTEEERPIRRVRRQ